MDIIRNNITITRKYGYSFNDVYSINGLRKLVCILLKFSGCFNSMLNFSISCLVKSFIIYLVKENYFNKYITR